MGDATLVVTAHRSWFVRPGLRPFQPFTVHVDGRMVGSAREPGAEVETQLGIGSHTIEAREDPSGSSTAGSLVRPPLAVSAPDPAHGEVTVVVTESGPDPNRRSRLGRWWSRGWEDHLRVPVGYRFSLSCRLKVGNTATWFAFYPLRTGP